MLNQLTFDQRMDGNNRQKSCHHKGTHDQQGDHSSRHISQNILLHLPKTNRDLMMMVRHLVRDNDDEESIVIAPFDKSNFPRSIHMYSSRRNMEISNANWKGFCPWSNGADCQRIRRHYGRPKYGQCTRNREFEINICTTG